MLLYLLNKKILQTLDEVGELSKHASVKPTNLSYGIVTKKVADWRDIEPTVEAVWHGAERAQLTPVLYSTREWLLSVDHPGIRELSIP